MSDTPRRSGYSIGVVLTAVLLVLKLTVDAHVTWLVVAAPALAELVVYLFILIVVLVDERVDAPWGR